MERQPASALGALVEQIAADILPRLRARLAVRGGVDLTLSELASTLSIVAADPGLSHRSAGSLRLARRHLQRLLDMVPAVAETESTADDSPADVAAEDRARSELFFVAPPDRPVTAAWVLRGSPRPVKVWSPPRPDRSPPGAKP